MIPLPSSVYLFTQHHEQRLNARNTALAGAGISILCTLLMAWAPSRLDLLLQFGNGFGQGFGWPAILKLIGVWFGRGERDRVLGWWSTSYILGGFLASSLSAWFMFHTRFMASSGFHPVYLASSAILLITAIFFAQETRGLPQPIPDEEKMDTPAGAWRRILGNRTIQFVSGMYFLPENDAVYAALLATALSYFRPWL